MLKNYLVSVIKSVEDCNVPELCGRILSVHACSLNIQTQSSEDIILYLDKDFDCKNREMSIEEAKKLDLKRNFIRSLGKYLQNVNLTD